MASISGTQGYWKVELVVNEASTSVINNTSSANWELWLKRTTGTSYMAGTPTINISVSGKTAYSGSQYFNVSGVTTTGVKLLSGTVSNIEHNANGTIKSNAISFSWSGSGFSPNSVSASGTYSTSTIPRKSSVSCTNANIGENATISISRHSSSFTHTLTYQFGSLSGTIAEKTSNVSVPFALPDTFYAETPNSNEKTGTITCTTYNGNTSLGSNTCSFKAFVTNANPTFTDFSYIDSGDIGSYDSSIITTDLTGDNSKIIKGYSHLKATILGEVSANKSASLSHYQIDNNQAAFSGTAPYSLYVRDYNKSTITMSVVDSRTNATLITKDISENFIDFFDVTKGSLSLARDSGGVGEGVILSFNGTFWNNNFGAVQNTIEATYRYKKTSSANWTTGTTTINPVTNGNNYSFSGQIAGDTSNHGFNVNDSYDIEVIVNDKLNCTIFSGIIGAGRPAIAVYKNNVSLGNKYDTSLGGEVQLWGDVYINGTRIS